MRSPIVWFGGKGNMVTKLLPLVPEHRVYVEPFGGGASLLFAKEPSLVEVYNDMNSGLVGFFRVLRDKKKFEEFYEKVKLMPYSREEYCFCRDNWEGKEDEVERALMWYTALRQSFGGRFSAGWGFVINRSNRGMAGPCSDWETIKELLPVISRRLLQVQIEHNDFRKIFETYDTPETFFYCDPPYLAETRSGGEYKHEMTDGDHADFLGIIKGIKGKCLISGYPNELYERELHGWKTLEWNTACSAVGKTRGTGIQGKGSAMEKQGRVEKVWMNYLVERNLDLFSY